jgi:hypothetical protein
MSPGMYLPAYISSNIGSSFVVVPVVHLIHHLTCTAERNINSSQLKQDITPRTLKVRMNFNFFLLGYVLTRDFRWYIAGYCIDKRDKQPGFEFK